MIFLYRIVDTNALHKIRLMNLIVIHALSLEWGKQKTRRTLNEKNQSIDFASSCVVNGYVFLFLFLHTFFFHNMLFDLILYSNNRMKKKKHHNFHRPSVLFRCVNEIGAIQTILMTALLVRFLYSLQRINLFCIALLIVVY